jgi:hypothetical protein
MEGDGVERHAAALLARAGDRPLSIGGSSVTAIEGELTGRPRARALRVPDIVQTRDQLASPITWPVLKVRGRANTRGMTRSRSPCRRASMIRENWT